jgi:hypothetical protein
MNEVVEISDIKKLLKREHLPTTITELADFQKAIENFQKEYAIDMIKSFFNDTFTYVKGEKKLEGFYRFIPQKRKPSDRRNVGLFSTSLCLRTLAAYNDEVKNSSLVETQEFLGTTPSSITKFISFVFKGLNQEFPPIFSNHTSKENLHIGTSPGFTAMIVCLCKLKRYIIESNSIENYKQVLLEQKELSNIINDLLIGLLSDISERIRVRKEILHPFILYKILHFIDLWKEELFCLLSDIWIGGKKICRTESHAFDDALKNKIRFNSKEKQINNKETEIRMFNFYFDEIYFLAKYELYRQMALKLSGDLALYDDKRMIYSLLIVSYNDRFSNNLIAKKALSLIFQTQCDNPNALWSTGQLIPISIDSMTAISSIESAYDLLSCKSLSKELVQYLSEIKSIFDFHVRTLQIKNGKLMGWYPPDERDKTPTSFTTAFALLFIKKFSWLISIAIQMKLEEDFRMNFKKPKMSFKEIYDSTGVKCKLHLLSPKFRSHGKTIFTSAILYGPPGTGKTSYARAIAEEMNYSFLELTPGDFYSGGETQILERINSLFAKMQHLNNTVIFIDEIDDLVIKRKDDNDKKDKKNFYDPRSLYVNTLLPKFQELHQKKDIILVLATNNIDNVDDAILRLGRIDLIIPVGGLSPHARLKMLYKSYSGLLGEIEQSKKSPILEKYLTSSEDMNFSELNSAITRMKLINENDFDPEVFSTLVRDYFDKKTFSDFRTNLNVKYNKYIRPNPGHTQDYCEFEKLGNHKNTFLAIFDSIENALKGLEIDEKQLEEDLSELMESGYHLIASSFYDDLLVLKDNLKDDNVYLRCENMIYNYINNLDFIGDTSISKTNKKKNK